MRTQPPALPCRVNKSFRPYVLDPPDAFKSILDKRVEPLLISSWDSPLFVVLYNMSCMFFKSAASKIVSMQYSQSKRSASNVRFVYCSTCRIVSELSASVTAVWVEKPRFSIVVIFLGREDTRRSRSRSCNCSTFGCDGGHRRQPSRLPR